MNEFEAILVVERGPTPAAQIPLSGEQLTVGRSAGNDLVLADPEVSRRHMRVVRRLDGFAVEDAGSTNGTFVNGQRITHLTLLQDGDTIDLGDTVRLRFMSLAPAAPVLDPADRPTQPLAHVAPAVAREPAAPLPPPVRPQPPQAVTPRPQAYSPAPESQPYYPPPPVYQTEQPRRGRGLWLGCGLLVALLLVCAGTFLVLDAYDQGRLLYCGPLASFFELILGPFGFAPLCS
jgi:pSer/pThr/pTyr-binding forkhead associated (FHA) protein